MIGNLCCAAASQRMRQSPLVQVANLHRSATITVREVLALVASSLSAMLGLFIYLFWKVFAQSLFVSRLNFLNLWTVDRRETNR